MSYTIPQALVFQEFETVPEAISAAQRACIIGPRRALIRYAEASEKEQGRLGAYNSLVDTAYAWPNRAAGDTVIPESVRLFLEDALLQYFVNPATGGTADIRATANSTALQANVLGDATGANVIRADGLVWAGATRSAALPCDARVGDGVRVAASVDGEVVELVTQVAGFLPEKVVASVAAATEDSRNLSARSEGSSSAAPGATVTPVGAAADRDLAVTVEGGEHVYTTGVGADTYQLICLEGGTYNTAVFALISASGTDSRSSFSLEGNPGDEETLGIKEALKAVFGAGSSSSGDLFFETGMTWTIDATFPVADADVVSSGAYTGLVNTTYVVRVTRGGHFASANLPQVTVSTTTGHDYSGPHEVVEDTPLAIGTHGVRVTFSGTEGLALGDQFYVSVTAEAAGAAQTIVLNDTLPADLVDVDPDTGAPRPLSVTLYIRKDIEVSKNRLGYAPLTNFDLEDTQIVVNSGIIGYDARVTSGAQMLPLPIKGGTLFVEYAATVAAGVGAVGSVTDVGALSTIAPVSAVLGTVDPANPIAYGVYKALSNVSGGSVLYVQTAGDTLADYLDALAILSQRDDVYILVPMTFDREVQDAVATHVTNMSGPEVGRWRICFLCRPAVSEAAVVGADTVALATIGDDPAATGTQFTRVAFTSGNVHLIDSGVRALDVVRAQYTSDGFGNVAYTEFVVDAVISPTELRVIGGPAAAVTVPSKVEIWRPYTRTELAAATAADATSFSSRRVYAVWPDYPEVAGVQVPGYFLAAALAGLKSSVLPQQGLTRVEVSGFDGMSRTTRLFGSAQLNTMAEAGMMIVTQSPTGQIYVRHSLSTDNSDINTSELMRTTNLDSISYVLLARLSNFQGKYNITDRLVELVRLTILEAISGLRMVTGSETLGPQVLGLNGDVVCMQHPIHRDRILVTVRPQLPYPNNDTEVHIVV